MFQKYITIGGRMPEKVIPRLMKGLRDFIPGEMVKRNFVIKNVVDVFESHGFLPLETPAIEMWDILAGKYGDDGEKLIYRFRDRGERDLGLRYDLTVPLSRVVAMHQNQLTFPLKRYQIQPVWRADKPGKGRFREFFQCDADIVGTKDLLADAEVIQISYKILQKLGFNNFKIKLNSRKVLRGIVETAGCDVAQEADICRSIDKLDKISADQVTEELIQRGIDKSKVQTIMDILKIRGTPQEVILQASHVLGSSESAAKGIEELSTLRTSLESMGLDPEKLELDISLARGLDYYTGAIFETVVEKPRIGSLSGGGRFDNLIGAMAGQDYPAVGNSVGLERIIVVMDELDMYPPELGFGVQVLICRFTDEDMDYTLKLAESFRREGLKTEIYLGASKKQKSLRGQLGYADEKGIPVVVMAGGDERAKGLVTLKDLRNQEQITVEKTGAAALIKKMLIKD